MMVPSVTVTQLPKDRSLLRGQVWWEVCRVALCSSLQLVWTVVISACLVGLLQQWSETWRRPGLEVCGLYRGLCLVLRAQQHQQMLWEYLGITAVLMLIIASAAEASNHRLTQDSELGWKRLRSNFWEALGSLCTTS